ncbi:MAG: ligase-associated DNA damage response endonuclease PdeM [Ferruginibacter sp.]
MPKFLPFTLEKEELLLTASRTIFWEAEKTLILSDLHLGKTGHFRKSGIAVPQQVFKEDMQRLLADIQFFKATSIIIVGDLFHSEFNKEHDLFLRWRNDISHVNFHLVKGNHDILKKTWYAEAGIEVHDKKYNVRNFLFTHDVAQCDDTDCYCISGHIHPGISVRGRGKQSLKFPCFYFAESYAVLPAFGRFTGTFPVKPVVGDAVFALVEDGIVRLT